MVDESGRHLTRIPRQPDAEVIAPMTKQAKIDFVRRALDRMKGDDLERLEARFQSLSDEDLDKPYGQSGQTCRELLHEEKERRSRWQQASDFFEAAAKSIK